MAEGNGAPTWTARALAPFDPALAVVVRRMIRWRGVDVTNDTLRRRALVMAPHPDDETLGAGVTIMRKVDAGTPVHVLVATDGSKAPVGDPAHVAALRSDELAAARTTLGLSAHDVTELGFPDAELDPADGDLVAAVRSVVRSFTPDDVLVTGPTDPHEDHAALAAVARLAVAGTAARLLTYPVWQFEHPVLLLRQLRRSGRPELVSTAGYRARKREAVAAYASQLAERDDDPEGLHPGFLRHFDSDVEMFFPEPGPRP